METITVSYTLIICLSIFLNTRRIIDANRGYVCSRRLKIANRGYNLHLSPEMDEVWKLYIRIPLLSISLNRNHGNVEWMALHYWIKDISLSILFNQLNWCWFWLWNPEIRVSRVHPKLQLWCTLATNSCQNGQSWTWVWTNFIQCDLIS